MGSYTPRHAKIEQNRFVATVGRRGAAMAVGAALVVPGVAAAEIVTASSASAASAPVLHWGSTGSYVKTAQRILNIPRTSRFDARTLHAVKNFQRIKHLKIDGYIGPNTWRALYGGAGGSKAAPKRPAPAKSSSSSNSSVVNIAKRYTGTPYVWGGSTPRGFDCSGLTSYVFRQVGRSLPRTARAQAGYTKRVSNPRPGDLVFFGSPAHHVGIYVGGDKMIDSPKPGSRVSVRQMWGAHYYGRV